MIEKGKFGVSEAVSLITITIVAKIFYTSPSAVVQIAGTAGWYLTIISGGAAFLSFMFVIMLLKRCPGKNIVDAYSTAFGPFIGFVFSFLLASALMFGAVSNTAEFSYVIQSYVLPRTPLFFIIGTCTIGVAILSFLGLESIARFSRLSVLILLTGFTAVILLGMQNYSIHRILPILGYGLKTTIYHGLLRSSFYADVIILAVFTGSLQGLKFVKKAGFLSLAISTIIVSISLLAFSLTFPYFVGEELTAPMYVLASLIDYGRFFQRLESIFLFIWYISSFIGVVALFYTSLCVYCQIFKINDKKSIVFPFAIIFCTASLLPSSIITVVDAIVPLYREYIWVVIFLPPIIGLLTSKLMKRGAS